VRRGRHVAAGTAEKASVTQNPRPATDGKDAKLGYSSDSTHQHIGSPCGESGGDYKLRTSKWQGSGQKARH
jgi:hypothetical protein